MSALELLDRAASSWSRLVVERGVDGLIAALVVVPIVLLARRASPHLRCALLLLVLVPLVAPLPRLPIGALGRAAPTLRNRFVELVDALPSFVADRWTSAASGPVTNSESGAARTSDSTAVIPSHAATAPPAGSARAVLFLGWLVVVELLLARWLFRDERLRRALRSARSVDSIGGVRVVESDAITAAAAVGLWTPTIVLPSRLRAALSPAGLRFVLRHELAHVRRGDLVLGALERLVRVVWFFHPATWIVGRLLAAERERACDDAALADVPSETRRACADAFLTSVEFANAARPRLAAPTVAMSRDGRHVRSRLVRIADPDRTVVRGMTSGAWLALVLCGAGVVAALQPAHAQPQDKPPSAADRALVEAVQRGARWLVRCQGKDGRFAAGEPRHEVGVTALAALALTDANRVAPSDDFAKAADRALDWLVAQQDHEGGCIGDAKNQHWVYGHAYATLALVEASDASQATATRKTAAQRGLDHLLVARNPYKGWRYGVADGDVDSSVTGLVEVVLCRAQKQGYAVESTAIVDGLRMLDELTDPKTGRTGYQQRGTPPARATDMMERFPADRSESLTAVALHARAALDGKVDANETTSHSLALLAALPPQWKVKDGSIDFYYWAHGTAALRLVGGEAWQSWRRALIGAMLPNQKKGGAEDGSFDPVDPWSKEGGRAYATALDVSALAAAARD